MHSAFRLITSAPVDAMCSLHMMRGMGAMCTLRMEAPSAG